MRSTTHSTPGTKLSAEERRTAIIRAVRRVFAEKGFHGTTTRELAEAAGVSEGLLFKHFPTKEALFSAMQASCCNEQDLLHMERLNALEPSTSTLVLLVHFLVSVIVGNERHQDEDQAIPFRLMLRSLAEDGEFARVLLRPLVEGWLPRVAQCVEAAVAAGDASASPVLPVLGGWFTEHVAAMILLHLLPRTPAIDYPVPRGKLVEQAVWFVLRGLGLKDRAIRRHYNPAALALFAR
jgi:AcrR family transcriptional regulator